MANGVQLGVSVVDNTKQGLSSAFNNTTKMTAKMAKQLVMEVNVAFPNIASKTKDLQSQLSKAFRAMGNIDFVGERLGKKGNVLGMLGFDGKELRKDMSLDAVKQHLDRLKTIQSKLKDNSLVSGNTGDAFKKEQKYITNAVRSLEAYKNTLELIFRTNAKFNTQLTTNASRLNDQAKSAKRAANETARAYQQSYAAIDRARNRFSRGGNSSKELADMRRYYQQQEQAARRAATETRKLENSLTRQGTLLGRLKSLASRYFSVYTVINFGKKVAEVTGYFQQQQVALEGILGSASEAKKLLNDISQFALESPFQTKELVQFTKQLAAFGVKENLFEKVKELADISTGLGVGMDRIILAYGQVKSATVLRGQELRQFTEAGIPMVEELAKKFTALNGEVVRTSDIFEMISKRQVSFDVVAEVLSDITKEGGQFYKMQENITNTMYGQMQKLRDLWTIAMRDIGKSSGGVLSGIIKLLQQMVIHGKSIAIAIAAAFAGNVITKAIVGHKLLNEKVKAYIKLLRMSTKARMHAFGGAAGAAVGIVIGLISKAAIEANKLRKSFEEIEASFAKENSKMIEGLESLTQKISQANFGTKEYADAVDTLAQNYGDFVSNDIIQTLKAQDEEALNTARSFGEIAENIKYAIEQYNEYKELEEKESEAENTISKNLRDKGIFQRLFGSNFERMMKQNEVGASDSIKEDYKNRYGELKRTQQIYEKFDEILEGSFDKFLLGDDLSEDAFKEILKEGILDIFPNISDSELKRIIELGVASAFGNVFRVNDIERLENVRIDKKKSGYYGMNKYFDAVDPNSTVYYDGSDKIKFQNNKEAAYVEALYNTLSEKFQTLIPVVERKISEEEIAGYRDFAENTLGAKSERDIQLIVARMIQKAQEEPISNSENLELTKTRLSEYISGGGKDKEYIKQLEDQIKLLELLAKLEGSYVKRNDGMIEASNFTNETISDINELLDNFKSTLSGQEDKLGWLEQVIKLFQGNTEIKSGRAAYVADNIENNMLYRYTITDDVVKSMWARFIPSNDNYEQKRNDVVTEWENVKKELESYREKGGKDKEYIQTLELKKQALETLASADYFNIKLEKDKKTRQSEKMPVELAEFLEELKNGYTRYKEAVQKGGMSVGLGYARTDEQFQEMFGQFFGGVDSEAFKKLGDLKLGKDNDTTAADLLKDKFLSGMEEGVLDFESAVEAVAQELEAYGTESGHEKYRKEYVNAAKQLRKWAETTFSKDNLTAALDEFNQELKKLTNTFERTNKAVDTYKKLIEQGTQNKLGGQLGMTAQESLRPQSSRQQDFIKQYVAAFNENMKKFGDEGAFTLDASSISSPQKIYEAIDKIDKLFRMQDNNFSATALGQSGETLKSELQKLADIMIAEMAGISGKAISGTPMSNAIANTALGAKSSMFNFAASQSIAGKYGLIDTAAIEKLLSSSKEQSTAFFDAFMKSEKGTMAADLLSGGIDKDAFFKKFDEEIAKLDVAIGGIPETLKFELNLRKEELGKSIDKFNAEGGKLGLGDEIRKYLDADKKYQKEYDDLMSKVRTTTGVKASLQYDKSALEGKINDGTATEEEIAKYQAIQLEIANCDASLKQYNDRLTEIGENGALGAAKEKMEALASAQDKLNHFSKGFDSMQNAVVAVVDSLKACVDTFAKFYDIVNDGENPKWLTDIQEGMGNFIENFKTAVAPILAVVGAIIAVIVVVETLTTACAALQIAAWPLLVIMAALIAIAAIVAAVMTAIQAHDNNLQASIDDLSEKVDEFKRAAEELNSVAERMTGIEKLKTQTDALGKSLSQATAYAEMARLEKEKKNTDNEKVEEYEQASFDAMEEFKNGMKDLHDELVNSVEDWSSAISDAIRSAFQNGENAARAFRSSIKEIMGDVVQNMLDMAILQPLIEDIIQDWTHSDELQQKYTTKGSYVDENGKVISTSDFDAEGYTKELLSNINNEDSAEKAYNAMTAVGDAYIDTVNNLPGFLKDAFGYSSDNSNLSGGISGITEDTARTLEGLANSMLMQMILANRELNTISQSGFAQVQVSWFNGMLEQAKATRIAAENLDRAISDMRNGIRPMSVTVV